MPPDPFILIFSKKMSKHIKHFIVYENYLEGLSFFFFMFIYLFILKERGSMSGGRRREGDRDRISSRLYAVSMEPDVGLQHRNCEIKAQAEIKSWTLN